MEAPTWKLIRILSAESVENSEIKLDESKTYICGRVRDKDIFCNSKLISKDHCIFFRDTNKIYVEDLKSTNGTFINGKRLNALEVVESRDNDVISLGIAALTTDNKDIFIYRLKKEDIVIDLETEPENDRQLEFCHSMISRVDNLNLEERCLEILERTTDSNQDHGSDDDVEILSESIRTFHSVTNIIEDRTIMKINIKFNMCGNNLPCIHINPTSNSAQLSDIITIPNQPHLAIENQRSRNPDGMEIEERIERVENTHIGQESSKLLEINRQNTEENSRKVGNRRKYSGNVQNHQEISSISATSSEEFVPKNTPTWKVSQVEDPKTNEIIQNEDQSRNKSPVRITLENEEYNKTKENSSQKAADNEEQSWKILNATTWEESRTSMLKVSEDKKQNRDKVLQNREDDWNKTSEQIKEKVEENEEQSWQKSTRPTVDNWDRNHKLMSKFTEYNEQNRRRFEENKEQSKSRISDSWKSSFTPVPDENSFSIRSSREENEFVNDRYKNPQDEMQISWNRSFSPPSDENPFTIGSRRDKNKSPISNIVSDTYKNQRGNMDRKWKKPSSSFSSKIRSESSFNRKENGTSDSDFITPDNNPFTIGSSMEETVSQFAENKFNNQPDKVQSKWKSSFTSISEENPFAVGSRGEENTSKVVEDRYKSQQNQVPNKWKNSFVLDSNGNSCTIESNKKGNSRSDLKHLTNYMEQNYKSISKVQEHREKSPCKIQGNNDESNMKSPALFKENRKIWNKALLSILLQDKELIRRKVPEKKEQRHKHKEMSRRRDLEKEKERPLRFDNEENRNSSKIVENKTTKRKYGEKTPVAVENAQKDPILDKIEKNTQKFKKIIVERIQKEEVVEPIEIQEEVANRISSEDNSSEEKKFLLRTSKVSKDKTLVQMLKTLNTIRYFIKDINEDHKESSEDDLSFLSKESSATSISDSISASSLGINIKRKKTKKLKSCREAGKVPLDEEPPLKNSRIEKMEKKLVNYESSSADCDLEDDMQVNRSVTSPERTDLNLKESLVQMECDLITTVKEYTPVPSDKSFQSDLKSDQVLMDILSWNPDEFLATEYINCKPCSENYNKVLYYSSMTYKNYEAYRTFLLSYLLLEVACGIKREFSLIERSPFFRECVVARESATEILLTERNSSLLSFKIKITCPESNVSQFPMVGDLLSLEIIGENHHSFSIFAYVCEVSVGAEGDATLIMEEKNVQLSATCTVVTKLLEFDVYKRRIKTLRVIVGVLVALNLVEGIEKLKSSPLLPLILHPETKTYSLSESSNKSGVLKSFRYQHLQENLDYEQLTAVLKITKVIQSEEPKISLITGLPGTGKTNIATKIILRLLAIQEEFEKQDQPMRILVCAGSKSEIDEILNRLSTEEKRLGMFHKLVRIGNLEKVQERVKDFTLRKLAMSYTEVKKEDIEMDPLKYSNDLDSLEKIILTNANVIFCTLSMCLSELMSSIFGEENPIPICIVDEAAQVNEIDILKPLSFGVKKLVLLGDTHKISQRNISLSVNSNKTALVAENIRFNSSLFSRLTANFAETKESPVINLEAQYRMNKRVTFFINQYFYNEILEYRDSGKKEFPLYSCSIFSIRSFKNFMAEATFAANLIFCIMHFTFVGDFEDFEKPISIGIIVPCSSSKKRLETEIEQWISGIFMDKREHFTINVDTIGGFKNQERDILIISCISKNPYLVLPSGEQWLYAAMTKVKYSLIMYGVKSTFEKTQKLCMWNSFVESLKNKKNLLKIKDPANPIELQKKLLRKQYQPIDW